MTKYFFKSILILIFLIIYFLLDEIKSILEYLLDE